MEFLFEILFEIFGEIILSLIFEGLAELGFHKAASVYSKPRHPVISGIGYLLLGGLAGGLSLVIFPESFVHTESLKLVNLFVTPVLLGLIMVMIGKLREKKGQERVKLDRFSYGFLFAFGMSFVRFMWAS
jgi:multisubunit Na+/H+ antiporter MnhG subunit